MAHGLAARAQTEGSQKCHLCREIFRFATGINNRGQVVGNDFDSRTPTIIGPMGSSGSTV